MAVHKGLKNYLTGLGAVLDKDGFWLEFIRHFSGKVCFPSPISIRTNIRVIGMSFGTL
jgi:hypothetical protein